jgi:predicted amino acid-binding ACT domain protein
MLIVDHDVCIEDPTRLPITRTISRLFFRDDGACLLILPESGGARSGDVVIAGPLATAVFTYGGRIPPTVGGRRILWHGAAHCSSGNVIQDAEWWARWCKDRHVKVRAFAKTRATFVFDTEWEIGMFSFHKKGVFKIQIQASDRPGTLYLVTDTLHTLALDILGAHSSRRHDFVTLDLTCGISRPATSLEIKDELRMALVGIASEIDVQGEAITSDDLAQLNGRFQSLLSVFISYSHADQEFALRLYDFLVNSGVKCWIDSHEFVPGAKLHATIQKGIQGHDKFLLICSASSLQSWWVDNELEEAFAKERESKQTVLVPIDIDGTVFENPPLNDKCIQIRSRHIGDFTEWVDEAKFDRAASKLFLALEPKS